MSKPSITPFSDSGEVLIRQMVADLDRQEAEVNPDLDRNAVAVARIVGPAVIRAMTALQDRDVPREEILDAFVAVLGNQVATLVLTVGADGAVPPDHPLVMALMGEFMDRVFDHIERAIVSPNIMREEFQMPRGGVA